MAEMISIFHDGAPVVTILPAMIFLPTTTRCSSSRALMVARPRCEWATPASPARSTACGTWSATGLMFSNPIHHHTIRRRLRCTSVLDSHGFE